MRKITHYREHIRNENPTNEKLREAAAADVLILSRGFSRLILSDLVLEYFICPGRTFIILEVLRHRLHTTYTHVDTHSSLSLSPSFKDSVPSIRRTFTENIFPRTPLRTCSNREWRIFGFSELDETRGGRRGGNNCREIFQRGERPPPPTSRSAIFPFVLVPVSVSRGVPSVASPMTLIIGRAPRSIKRFRATWSPSGLGIGAVSKPPELLQLTLDLYWDWLSVTRVSFFPGFFPPFVRRSFEIGRKSGPRGGKRKVSKGGREVLDRSLSSREMPILPSLLASLW